MADVRQIISRILSDPRVASNSNLASKVYRDEPILITAPQMASYTPPRIREMRRLAKPFDAEAKIFHEQARFMEDFEDEADFRGTVVQYFPTYQALTDAQLRGYFSWRTKLRKGVIGKTSLSFAFLYVYELLHGIGAASAEEGFRTLRTFWKTYRELDPGIDGYVALWLKDYVVYYNLDRAFLEGLPDIEFERAVAVLLNYAAHSVDEVFAALNALSSYDLSRSKFYLLHPDKVRNAAVRVFDAVSKYYNRNPEKGAREKLFGRVVVNSYVMFRSAVFHPRAGRENREYAIGEGHRYICRNGVWSCERFVGYGLNNKKIGAVLKTVDFLLRERAGYKSTLQPGKVSKVLRGKIEKELAKYEQEERERAARVVSIDVSKLHGIRAEARTTRERLLVEEADEIAEENAAPAAATEKDDDAETQFLRRLLRGEERDSLLRQSGLLESVLVDAINEKYFDRFGDTIIVDDGNGPEVVEDYREELEEFFKEIKQQFV